MKTKALGRESFWKRYKYSAIVFVFIFLYNFFYVNSGNLWEVSGYAYTLHLVDFSVGFHTGVLPGAVFYGLFGKYASKTAVSIYVLVLLTIFMLILSVLVGKIITEFMDRKNINSLWLVLFFLVGPYTIANCFYWFAFFDMYIFLISILFFAFLENRVTVCFIPVLFVISVLIHFSSFLTCIPLFTIVLLYKTIQEESQNRKFKLILGISLFLTITVGIYLLLFESTNLRYSLEQFHDLLSKRGGADYASDDRAYYDYLFYHTVTVDADISFSDGWDASKSALANLVSYFIGYIRFNYDLMTMNGYEWMLQEAMRLVVTLPFFGGFYLFIIRFIKQKGIHKKTIGPLLPLLLTLLQFPVALIAILFSTDIMRWINMTITALIIELIYFAYNDRDFSISIEAFIERNRIWLLAYLFITATSIIK